MNDFEYKLRMWVLMQISSLQKEITKYMIEQKNLAIENNELMKKNQNELLYLHTEIYKEERKNIWTANTIENINKTITNASDKIMFFWFTENKNFKKQIDIMEEKCEEMFNYFEQKIYEYDKKFEDISTTFQIIKEQIVEELWLIKNKQKPD